MRWEKLLQHFHPLPNYLHWAGLNCSPPSAWYIIAIIIQHYFSASILSGARLAKTDAEKSHPTRPQGGHQSQSLISEMNITKGSCHWSWNHWQPLGGSSPSPWLQVCLSCCTRVILIDEISRNVTVSEPAEGRRKITEGLGMLTTPVWLWIKRQFLYFDDHPTCQFTWSIFYSYTINL